MPYGKFDPRGEKTRETSLLAEEKKTSSFVIFLQLFAIFTLLRAVMLIAGMHFFIIPYFDHYLFKLIHIVVP